jgi:hypothetical protein
MAVRFVRCHGNMKITTGNTGLAGFPRLRCLPIRRVEMMCNRSHKFDVKYANSHGRQAPTQIQSSRKRIFFKKMDSPLGSRSHSRGVRESRDEGELLQLLQRRGSSGGCGCFRSELLRRRREALSVQHHRDIDWNCDSANDWEDGGIGRSLESVENRQISA